MLLQIVWLHRLTGKCSPIFWRKFIGFGTHRVAGVVVVASSTTVVMLWVFVTVILLQFFFLKLFLTDSYTWCFLMMRIAALQWNFWKTSPNRSFDLEDACATRSYSPGKPKTVPKGKKINLAKTSHPCLSKKIPTKTTKKTTWRDRPPETTGGPCADGMIWSKS